MSVFSWFSKKSSASEEQTAQTKNALGKTRESFLSKLGRIVAGKREIDADFLDEIEEFCKNRALGNAVINAAELIEKGNYGEVEKKVRKGEANF